MCYVNSSVLLTKFDRNFRTYRRNAKPTKIFIHEDNPLLRRIIVIIINMQFVRIYSNEFIGILIDETSFEKK